MTIEDGQKQLLSSSLTIARYLAQSFKPELLGGKNAFEQAQVDMWIQIIRSEVEPLSRSISYMAMGHVKTNQVEY